MLLHLPLSSVFLALWYEIFCFRIQLLYLCSYATWLTGGWWVVSGVVREQDFLICFSFLLFCLSVITFPFAIYWFSTKLPLCVVGRLHTRTLKNQTVKYYISVQDCLHALTKLTLKSKTLDFALSSRQGLNNKLNQFCSAHLEDTRGPLQDGQIRKLWCMIVSFQFKILLELEHSIAPGYK